MSTVELKYGIIALVVCLFCLPGNILSAQSTTTVDNMPDSLLRIAARLPRQAQKAQFWLAKTAEFRDDRPQLAWSCLEHSFELTKRMNNDQLRGQSYFWRAWLTANGDPSSLEMDLAKTDLRLATQLLEQTKDPVWMTRIHLLAVFISIYSNDLQQAENHLQLAQETAPRIKNRRDSLSMEAKIQTSLASIAQIRTPNNQNLAKEALSRALNIYVELKDDRGKVAILRNLLQLAEPEEAEKRFEEAYVLLNELENEPALADLLQSMGQYYHRRFKDTDSLNWYSRSMPYFRQAIQFTASPQAETWFSIGANYHLRAYLASLASGSDKFFEKIYADSAQTAYLKAVQFAQRENNTGVLADAVENLAYVCKLSGDCDKALLLTSTIYQSAIDSSKAIATENQIRQKKYEQQLLSRQARRKQNSILLSAGLLLAILLGSSLFTYQRQQIRIREEQIRRLKETMESRLEALRAQMNPHFISNTLNVLEAHFNLGRTEQASEHIVEFAGLCRKTLDNARKKVISLDEELKLQEHYLKLQQSGFPEELSYVIDVDPPVKLAAWGVPPMLLNPFVENAVLHGVLKKQAPGVVTIKIRQLNKDQIQCAIEDDGLGREKVREMQARMVFSDRKSYGTAIAREQIEKIEGADLEIEDIQLNGKAGGTRVRITLPKIPPK